MRLPTNQLSKDILSKFAHSLVKQGSLFIIFITSAVYLGPSIFGEYNYALAVVMFAAILADFGVSLSATRFIAEVSPSKKRVQKVRDNAFCTVLWMSSIATIVVIVSAEFFLKEMTAYLLPLVLLVWAVPVASLGEAVLRGQKQFLRLLQFASGAVVLSLPLALLLIIHAGLIGAILANAVFYGFLAAAMMLATGMYRPAFNRRIMKKISSYAVIIGFASIGYFLYTRADLIILGRAGFLQEVGYYEIVGKAYQTVLLGFTIVGSVLAPYSVEKWKINKMAVLESVRRHGIQSFVAGVILCGVVWAGTLIAVREFLPAYYTHEFMLIVSVFVFVIPLSVVEALISNGYITPLGHAFKLMIIILCAGIINVLADIVAIWLFGYVGVIGVTVVVHNIANALKLAIFYRDLKDKAQ